MHSESETGDVSEGKEVDVVLPPRPDAYESGAKDYEEWKTFWRAHVEAWKASGLPQAEYCRKHHLVVSTFNGWKRKISGQAPGPRRHRAPGANSAGRWKKKTPAPAAATSPVFVPVRVTPSSNAAAWAVEVQCANGRVLRLRECVDTGTLAALLHALEARGC